MSGGDTKRKAEPGAYKNPKKARTKGASAMQPAASKADGASGVLLMKGEAADSTGPVNNEKFWKRRIENVPVDEVYVFCSMIAADAYHDAVGLLPQLFHAQKPKGK